MIIEKAQELGMAICESAEFRHMMDAKAAMDSNEKIQQLTQAYTEKQDAIVNMMEKEDADRATLMELSREMDEIQRELMLEPAFMEAMAAQGAFQGLMMRVNQTIAACIGMEDTNLGAPGAGGCTGVCSACSGCKH